MDVSILLAMQSRVVSVEAAELERRSDAIGELHAGTLAGLIVRGAFEPRLLERALERLGAGEVRLPRVEVPVLRGYLLGLPLVAADAGLDAYLDSADQFRAGCHQLFGGALDLEATLRGLLSRLAGGREVTVPERGGRRYLPAGFRVLVDGDALPFHFENSTFDNPRMSGLNPTLDRSSLMSFYVPVSQSGRGGELRLYPVDARGDGERVIEQLGGNQAARAWFESRGFETVRPAIGDLLLFNGGRFYHEVTPVEDGPRWTLGGFLALTADGRAVRFWS
jgi:hapalindole-type alkaloid chlorinase